MGARQGDSVLTAAMKPRAQSSEKKGDSREHDARTGNAGSATPQEYPAQLARVAKLRARIAHHVPAYHPKIPRQNATTEASAKKRTAACH